MVRFQQVQKCGNQLLVIIISLRETEFCLH